MIIQNNVSLTNFTTLKLGGITDRLYIPESTIELLELVNEDENFQYFIGGGSNLLINNRRFDKVISLKRFDKSIQHDMFGLYEVGASLETTKLVQTINNDGFGGIEYLCTVPGLVGGAIAMNAGTSIKEGRSISDYVISVDVIDRERKRITTIANLDCGFMPRISMFKNNPRYIIVKARFRFKPQDKNVSDILRKDKVAYSKYNHDYSAPNAGSVFATFNPKIMKVLRKLQYGDKTGVHFSGKTMNWILNENSTKSQEAIALIRKVEKIHKLLKKQCEKELIIWE